MRRLILPVALAVLAAVAVLVTGCSGTPNATSLLSARLLAVGDLPAGWAATRVNPSGVQASAPCLTGLTTPASSPPGALSATAGFVQGPSIPSLGEALFGGPQAAQRWTAVNHAMAACRSAVITVGGQRAAVRIRPLAFPRVGTSSTAFQWSFTLSGIQINVDFVAFATKDYPGYISYSGLGTPSTATVLAFADAAAVKAAAGSTPPVPDSVSVTSEPVRTVTTGLGTVAYRETGSGPPLVLIMGYGGTMSGWDPRLVDALASRHRVVTFDNAGIGGTSALPGTLTIDAMADQASALITALRLGRADVLGWSMGSMIAAALAVQHPAQVNRLLLCAAYPGDGSASRPSPAAIAALSSSDQQVVMTDLFPADQTGARNAYLTATSSYPAAAPAPAAIVSAQAKAITAWWAGQDPAGRRVASIGARTLIADGAADRLDPAVNATVLAGQIAGSTLVRYPDAGHAFLFQDQAAFIPAVESFLSAGSG
ncbi:MAG TPA: alpha/beta hydrolase [Trebonia sp.]